MLGGGIAAGDQPKVEKMGGGGTESGMSRRAYRVACQSTMTFFS
jgi:hypothetical protein